MAIKITEKAFEEIIPFNELELGSVFIIKDRDAFCYYDDDKYKYMKISDDVDGNYNAVNLTNGYFSLANIGSDTNVLEVRAELILDDSNYDY